MRTNAWITRPTSSILFSLWAYLCTLVMAAMAPRYLQGGARDLILWLPLLTTILVLGIIVTVYRASDEYIRRRLVNAAALTGVILAFGTLVYYCLERLGLPPLSMIVVNLFGWSVFTALTLWVLHRAR